MSEVRTEKVELTLEQIQAFYGLLEVDGGNIHITSPHEVKTNVSSHTVMYKCFCPVSKKMKFLYNAKIWICLGPVLGDVSQVNRCEAYATVAVRFNTAENARRNWDKTLKTEEGVLFPSYKGRRTSRIRIEEVPLDAEVAWATLLQDRDDKVTILQINRIPDKHWCGQAVEALVQASPEVLENIPNRLLVDKGQSPKPLLQVRAQWLYSLRVWISQRSKDEKARARCNQKIPAQVVTQS